uniref:peptidylprolyl isomerase n=1 Tax=Zea mays TaxID=4577 RepID=B6SH56_MAIZE|nr:FK506-binding protein 39 kDa [Zea mays]
MAFWGVEVKPGKPYTHIHHADHGRLRICQATLGNCDAAARTVLQCNVGNKIPIKLCSLNPKLAETCHLEVEFEEVDDVIFSVIGHSSIHLSGYYVCASNRSNVGDDESESYGEDIGHSSTDEEHDTSEDSYESDFIDDREVPLSEKYGSGSIDDSDDECTQRCHRQKAEKTTQNAERRRRLKKHQVGSTDYDDDDTPVMKHVAKRCAPKISDSGDDDTPVTKPVVKRRASIFDSDSDEDDNVPISLALGKKGNAKVAEETEHQNGQANGITKKRIIDVKKRKQSSISEDPASSMDMTDANAPSVSKQVDEIKKKSKKKMRNQSGENNEKQSNIRTLDDGLVVEYLSMGNNDAKVASDGCKVYIKYVGMLKDGKIVESNVSEKPYKFKLGAGKVIRGWDVGIHGMRVGEKRKLTVPPSMLSGGKSVGEVPENSSVIYEIELVKVK